MAGFHEIAYQTYLKQADLKLIHRVVVVVVVMGVVVMYLLPT